MNNYEEDGVLISQDAIENSLHKKAKRKQTLAQLPVYRAVGNLKEVITKAFVSDQNISLINYLDFRLLWKRKHQVLAFPFLWEKAKSI